MIAFDHMRISFSQLEWAPNIVKLYQELLSNDEVLTEKPERPEMHNYLQSKEQNYSKM
jgi:hypothetical protein